MSEVPPPRLVAFLDESGCSGNQFGAGSSEFLVIGAAVYAAAAEPEVLSIFRRPVTDLSAKRQDFVKFSRNHDVDNFYLTQQLSKKPVRLVQVALHKPSMVGTFSRANHKEEYQYIAKFVIERISWMGNYVVCEPRQSEVVRWRTSPS